MIKVSETTKKLIRKIKEKKELSGLADEFIADFLSKNYASILSSRKLSEKDEKVIIGLARTKLRRKSGMFHISPKSIGSSELSTIINKHSSTKERIAFYPRLTTIISS